jgi:hypothetical protein
MDEAPFEPVVKRAFELVERSLSLHRLGRTGTTLGVCLIVLLSADFGLAIVGASQVTPTTPADSSGVAHSVAAPVVPSTAGHAGASHGGHRAVSRESTVPARPPAPARSTTTTATPVVPTLPTPSMAPVPISPATTTTTAPLQSPPPFSWAQPVALGGVPGYLSGIDCPSASLCVATDSSGDIFSSTDLEAGSSAWSSVNIAGQTALGAVSCPTVTLCVVPDQSGVVISTNPTGGAGAWTQTNLVAPSSTQSGGGWDGVSCPSPALCVVVGRSVIATSTDPAAGAWTVVPAPKDALFSKPDPLSAVSCPIASFCVAVGALGMTYVSTNPTAGTASWSGTDADFFSAQICQQCTNLANSLVGVSCPTPSMCVAIDPIGDVISSSDPGAAAPAWTITALNDQWIPLDFVTCPSSTFCLAGPHFSSSPSGGDGWVGAGFTHESAVSCPTVVTCVAVTGDDVSIGSYDG